MIQAQHGGEIFTRQARRGFHRDVGVGVGGIADHEHLHVARGDGIERPALHGENRAVGFEQIFALHPRPARTRADQQGNVDVLERGHRIRMRAHAHEQGKRAIVELHHHALQGFLRFLIGDLQQLQNDRLIFAQHFAGSDAEQ